jgi:ribonuclease HI
MRIGGVLKSPDGDTVEISFAAGHGDSNEAEYLALIAVLQEAVRMQPPRLTVYGDSQVVIEQMKGASNADAIHLKALHAQATQLLSQLNAVSLRWTPRRNNVEADTLSQQCLLQGSDT